MKKNLGTTDRGIRAVLGLGIIAFGIANHTWLGAIGAIPLLTALIGFCPAYCPLGLSTAWKSRGGNCCAGGKCK